MIISAQSVSDKFGNTAFKVSITNEEGEIETKVISLQSFCSLLMGSAVVKSDIISYTRLGLHDADNEIKPYECLYGTKPGCFGVIFEIPKAKRPLIFYDQGNFIPFPRLVFALKIENGHLVGKWCFAVKGNRPLSDNTEFYRYPFGNVAESGSVCFGNIKIADTLKKHCDIDGCRKLVEQFFQGSTNDDYYHIGNKVSLPLKQYELISKLKKFRSFPDKILVKSEKDNMATLLKNMGCN